MTIWEFRTQLEKNPNKEAFLVSTFLEEHCPGFKWEVSGPITVEFSKYEPYSKIFFYGYNYLHTRFRCTVRNDKPAKYYRY